MRLLCEWLAFFVLVTVAACSTGCSSFAIRNGDCEAAYTRFMGDIEGAKGSNICGAGAEVQKAKVDSEAISEVTSPVKALGYGKAVEAAAPLVAPLLK